VKAYDKTTYAEIELDEHGKCPECDSDLSAGDIFDVLRPQDWCKTKTDEELRAHIQACYSPPHKFSRLVGVEYPYGHPRRYDGVSEWMCPDCKHSWYRFKPQPKKGAKA